MFRKLVSNLPFSPALVGQLGFYAKRLKKEEVSRRAGLILTALALVIQSFAVFAPPQSANASDPSDIIRGGAYSAQDVLNAYDNQGDIYMLFSENLGITRDEIAGLQPGRINNPDGEGWISWARRNYSVAWSQVTTHKVNQTTMYSWYLRDDPYQGNGPMDVLIGNSARLGRFAINPHCGNVMALQTYPNTPTPPPPPPPAPTPVTSCSVLTRAIIDRTRSTLSASAHVENGGTINSYTFTVKDASGKVVFTQKIDTHATTTTTDQIDLKTAGKYTAQVVVGTSLGDRTGDSCATSFTIAPPDKCKLNPDLTVEDKECQPCKDNPDLWYKSPDCAEKTLSGKTAKNLTQNQDATKVTALAGDRIEYQVFVDNNGKVPAHVNFKEDLGDVLQYAILQDNGGGTYDEKTHTLSWGDITLKSGERQTRTFVVNVMSPIPTMAKGESRPGSYDCVMTNVFGNTKLDVGVKCETPKIVETVVKELPKTGPTENMIFAGILAAVVVYFWARSRQLGKEVKLVRKDFSMGTI